MGYDNSCVVRLPESELQRKEIDGRSDTEIRSVAHDSFVKSG